MDDTILLDKIKRGDKNAFEQLVHKYYQELFYTALGMVRSGWDALDICQNTFMKAYTAVHSLKDNQKFRPWINKILMNQCNDFFRRNKKYVYSETVEKIEMMSEMSDENLDLIKFLSMLNEDSRRVLVLRYFQDLPVKEIAEICRCPEGTVKSRISNALKELKNRMAASERKEG